MKIKSGTINSQDLIYQYLPANYTEVLTSTVACKSCPQSDDLMIGFWGQSPAWIKGLFKLRNWIVKPLGLKGDGIGDENSEQMAHAIRNGERYQIMDIPAKSPNETVLSLTDKHLKMYLSIRVDAVGDANYRLKLSNVVLFYNMLGFVYFYTIFPFEYIIVRSMMKQMIRRACL